MDGPRLGGPGAQHASLSFPVVEPRVLELRRSIVDFQRTELH